MEKLSVGIASRGGLVASGDGSLSALSSGPRRHTFAGGTHTAPLKAVGISQPPPVGALISAAQPANVDTNPNEYHRLANSPHSPYHDGRSCPGLRAKSAPGSLPRASSTTTDTAPERDPFAFTSADDDTDTEADVDHDKSEGEDNDASLPETSHACVTGAHDVSRIAPTPAEATGPNTCTILALWRPAFAPHAAFPESPSIRKTYTMLRMLLALPATLHRPLRQPALNAAAVPTPFTLQAQPRTVQAFTEGAARPPSTTARSCTTIIRWIPPLSPILLALRNGRAVSEPCEHAALDSLQALLQHQPQQHSAPPLGALHDGPTACTAVIPWQSPEEVLLRRRLPQIQARLTVRPAAVLRARRPPARVLRAIVACRWQACASLALRKPLHTFDWAPHAAPTLPRRSTRCARAAPQQLTIMWAPLSDIIRRSARAFLPTAGNTAARENTCRAVIVWVSLEDVLRPDRKVLRANRASACAASVTSLMLPDPAWLLHRPLFLPPPPAASMALSMWQAPAAVLRPQHAHPLQVCGRGSPRISRGTSRVLSMLRAMASAASAPPSVRANNCTDLIIVRSQAKHIMLARSPSPSPKAHPPSPLRHMPRLEAPLPPAARTAALGLAASCALQPSLHAVACYDAGTARPPQFSVAPAAAGHVDLASAAPQALPLQLRGMRKPSPRMLRAIADRQWDALAALVLRGPLRAPCCGLRAAPQLLRHDLRCPHGAPQQLTIVWAPLREMIDRSVRMSHSAPGQRPLFRNKCTAIIPWAAPESVVLAPLRKLPQASPATTTATPPQPTRLVAMLRLPFGLPSTLLPSAASAHTALVPRRAYAEVTTKCVSRGTRHVLRMLREMSSTRTAASRSRANACRDLIVFCPALPGGEAGGEEWEDEADEVAEEVQQEAARVLPGWIAVMRRAISVLWTVAFLTLMVVWLSATP